MILEAWGYKTAVAEFISSEHTPKNVMISAIRKKTVAEPDKEVLKRISALKKEFGIEFHYLEKLLKKGI